MTEWEIWARCTNCLHILEKPSFGNLWFTKNSFGLFVQIAENIQSMKQLEQKRIWRGKIMEIK
jgi:hypothetical protein